MSVLDKLVEAYLGKPNGSGKAKRLIFVYGEQRVFACENLKMRTLAGEALEGFATSNNRNHALSCLDQMIYDPIFPPLVDDVKKVVGVLGDLKESKHFSLICDMLVGISDVNNKDYLIEFVKGAEKLTSPRLLEIAKKKGWGRTGPISLCSLLGRGTVKGLVHFNSYPRQADVVDVCLKFDLYFSNSIGRLLMEERWNPNFGYVLDYLKETPLTPPTLNTLTVIAKAPAYGQYAERNTAVLNTFLAIIYDGLALEVQDELTMPEITLLLRAYESVVPRFEIRYRKAAQDEFVSMLNKKLEEGETVSQKKTILREWSRNVCDYIQRHPDALLLEVGV